MLLVACRMGILLFSFFATSELQFGTFSLCFTRSYVAVDDPVTMPACILLNLECGGRGGVTGQRNLLGAVKLKNLLWALFLSNKINHTF